MTLFTRIKNLITADLHEVLDKCENPMTMLQHHLRELDGQVEEAKKALSHQFYLEKKYEILIAAAEENAAKRTNQAELAVSRGEDTIEKIALQEKISEEAKVQMLRDQAAITKANTAKLVEQIEKLKANYQDFQFRKLDLESKVHAAKAIKQGQKMLSAFQFEGASKGLAKAQEYVYKLEAEAQASQHFQEFTTTPAISAVFNDEVEKQFESIKHFQNE
ncbi:PspA/IM30 family protein [Neobacillus terrae]|uniref:PspA/IM30 family protein n=1 Tax=Neobacillus terrae TaxID=3034837 RepID=UPI00140974C3|nr:PspA/IM30 family protein [Neobacillus terrae]NHM31900.1 PspA/IM30 family protein [Neobacillus terrae]